MLVDKQYKKIRAPASESYYDAARLKAFLLSHKPRVTNFRSKSMFAVLTLRGSGPGKLFKTENKYMSKLIEIHNSITCAFPKEG